MAAKPSKAERVSELLQKGLELYGTGGTDRNYDVHHITGSWTETGVTWTTQPTFAATADATVALGTTTPAWKIWNVATVVQAWVDGTYANNGLLVKDNLEDNAGNINWTFATRENGTAANQPILRVNYTPAGGGWSCTYIGTGTCAAANPKEASPTATPMSSVKAAGTTVDINYTAGCAAADHSVYWGTGPIAGTLAWTGAACGLGTSGAASFDPGTPASDLLYFVVVAYNATAEGSYGQDSSLVEEPEAVGVGACDRTQNLAGTCP